MDYSLYHDESKIDGFWHGILLVPNSKKKELLELLGTVRKNTKFSYEIGIKKVKNKKGKITNCAEGFLNVGIASLISQNKNLKYPIDLMHTNNGIKEYKQIIPNIGTKFILFREKNNLKKVENYPDYGSFIETSFRIGLKGGIHFLGNNENEINITKMHFDGHEHYGRKLDKRRIIDRLNGLRNYCNIENTTNLIDDRNSNHNNANSQSYIDCQFLQLTDLLIGAFRSNLGFETKDIHRKIGIQTKDLIEKYRKGNVRMQNSRWNNSFCLSQCELSNQGWKFEHLDFNPKKTIKQFELEL
ncbi:hypothetical protein [Tenacibaculum insulae]|uniref:hypothetical protein n=1 Tax=Tenacibaculum insulae TaxID=2029677 RepID=UPI003AB48F65